MNPFASGRKFCVCFDVSWDGPCVLVCPGMAHFPSALRVLSGGGQWVEVTDKHSTCDNTDAKGHHLSLLFPNHPLEPAGPCRPFTCLDADMVLGRREGGLGFDWQLSSLLWACPSLPPHSSWLQKPMRGGSCLQGNVCSSLEQTLGWGPSFPLAATETGAT